MTNLKVFNVVKITLHKHVKLCRIVIFCWAVLSFIATIFFTDPLSSVHLFGHTLSFWIAQQGSILFFIIVIFYIVKKLDKL